MEIQEFLPRSMIVQARFAASTSFLDRRGQVLDLLLELLESQAWEAGEGNVRVRGSNDGIVAVTSFQDIRVQIQGVVDAEGDPARASSIVEKTLSVLGVSEIATVGVRTFWMASASSFSDAQEWLLERIGRPSELFKALSARPSDSGWVFEFHDAAPKWTLRLGPMKRAQVGTLGVVAEGQLENVPENSAYFDLDRVASDRRVALVSAEDEVRKGVERNLDAARRLVLALHPGAGSL